MIYSYRRVSTDEQANGPMAQADAIHRYMGSRPDSAYITRRDYFDDGVSGSVPLYDRPQGGAMYSAMNKGDTVVVAKLDRLFRSVADAAATINAWIKDDITIISIAEGFDMGNPYGRAMAQMASVFAELEREMIRSRTKDALDAKRSRGECVGEVPYGYFRMADLICPYLPEQKVISDMCAMHFNGLDFRKIADALNKDNITAKKGGVWHKTQVRRVIERALKQTRRKADMLC